MLFYCLELSENSKTKRARISFCFFFSFHMPINGFSRYGTQNLYFGCVSLYLYVWCTRDETALQRIYLMAHTWKMTTLSVPFETEE